MLLSTINALRRPNGRHRSNSLAKIDTDLSKRFSLARIIGFFWPNEADVLIITFHILDGIVRLALDAELTTFRRSSRN